MLNPLQVNSAHFGWAATLQDQLLGLVENTDNHGLVLQTLDILVAVRVASLQDLDEFFVQTLDSGQETSLNL